MRGCHNLRFDCIQKYASLSEFSSFSFNICNKILLTVHDVTKREFKKLLRRRRRQRRLKNEFIFYLRILEYSYVIYFVYHYQSSRETESGTPQ